VTAKRRADGPAVKRKPKPAGPGSGRAKKRLLKIAKWGLIAALTGSLVLIGVFVYLYKTTSIPNPNKDFQTQSSFVYYSDSKTQIGQYATQNRQIIPLS
jgi:membrane peptidoglycan carboxypeptidase